MRESLRPTWKSRPMASSLLPRLPGRTEWPVSGRCRVQSQQGTEAGLITAWLLLSHRREWQQGGLGVGGHMRDAGSLHNRANANGEECSRDQGGRAKSRLSPGARHRVGAVCTSLPGRAGGAQSGPCAPVVPAPPPKEQVWRAALGVSRCSLLSAGAHPVWGSATVTCGIRKLRLPPSPRRRRSLHLSPGGPPGAAVNSVARWLPKLQPLPALWEGGKPTGSPPPPPPTFPMSCPHWKDKGSVLAASASAPGLGTWPSSQRPLGLTSAPPHIQAVKCAPLSRV